MPRQNRPGAGPEKTAWAGRLELQPEALDDLRYWVDEDPRVARKVLKLIEAARRTPHQGEGKPEPLRHLGPDVWSRRITQEDRLVYRVMADGIDGLQARYHYA
jgi:toxin YoeB